MDCIYINLASAAGRRHRLEANFAACKKPGWTLTRFPAVDKTYVERNAVAGATKPGEKGCFLSHRVLMNERLTGDESYLIIEDDATLGERTCALIDAMLEQNRNLDWDIIFTDVCIPQMTLMFELLKRRRELATKRIEATLINLRGLCFAGSTAYIVNGKSKRKVHEVLSGYMALDLPYDLYLRQLSHKGILNVYTLFPFVTTVSDDFDASQIKASGVSPLELAWNLFRRMIWTERNLNSCKTTLDAFRQEWCRDEPPVKVPGGDEELIAFTNLFASMVGAVAGTVGNFKAGAL